MPRSRTSCAPTKEKTQGRIGAGFEQDLRIAQFLHQLFAYKREEQPQGSARVTHLDPHFHV